MSSDVQNQKIATSNFPWEENSDDACGRKTREAMRCQAQYTVRIYTKPGQDFAKLTKIQISFAEPLNKSF